MLELDSVKVLAEGLVVPEGPVVMGDGSVIFTQAGAGRLSRLDRGEVDVVAEVGGGPAGCAVGPDGALYVCNNGGLEGTERTQPCIQRVDLLTGEHRLLYSESDGMPLQGPNDLVFDSTGNFWFTDHKGGAIFYASPDGKNITRVLTGLWTPNGIGLSPDEDVLYWAQTVTRQVVRRRISSPGCVVASPGHGVGAVLRSGGIDPFSVLAGLPGTQELDSMAIEADGHVCVGTLVDGGITVISPDGSQVQKFVPPPHLTDGVVTNLCFGGEDMRTAYVTMAEHGRLISCQWPRPGLRLPFQSF